MKHAPVVIAWVYFILMAVFITFPGLNVANRVEPYVFGLPFFLAWFMGWIVGALFVFYLLYRRADRA